MPASLPAQYTVLVPISFDSGQRTIVNQFSDGYRQRIVDGVNPDIDRQRLKIIVGNDTDANTLDIFLKARAIDPLSWTPPGGSTALNYLVAQPFQKTLNRAQEWVFEFDIERVPL